MNKELEEYSFLTRHENIKWNLVLNLPLGQTQYLCTAPLAKSSSPLRVGPTASAKANDKNVYNGDLWSINWIYTWHSIFFRLPANWKLVGKRGCRPWNVQWWLGFNRTTPRRFGVPGHVELRYTNTVTFMSSWCCDAINLVTL